jgi:sugar phosphate isomerase/epimerase
VERAAALRLRLTLENNSKAPDHLLLDVQQTLNTFSCRFFGANLDFANYVTTGQDPIAAVRGLARWINYVHAKDVRKTAEGWQSTYLGNGTLPLKDIIGALDATGKRIPLCFEFPGEGDPEGSIRKSLKFLAALEG